MNMIITLGPTGTYSEIVSKKLFPDREIILKNSFFEIFSSHQHGDVMVLPLENSVNGSVIEVWEQIAKRNLYISKNHIQPIEHALGSQQTERAEVKTIYGHPQALAQCSEHLYTDYPHVVTEATTSTGVAIAKAKQDPSGAAIAHESAIKAAGLNIIHEHLNDIPTNQTVFGVISDEDLYPNEPKTKTIIELTPQVDRHGLLFNILEIIESEELNLSRLESRPQGDNLGKYKFFIDIQTAPDSEAFLRVREQLEVENKVKVLGAC